MEPVRNSRLVKLHYDSPEPQRAAAILNALVKNYINLNLERRFDASTYARNFLQERLQQVKAKLEDSERELVGFCPPGTNHQRRRQAEHRFPELWRPPTPGWPRPRRNGSPPRRTTDR